MSGGDFSNQVMELIPVDEQISSPKAGRPHLVILGAGASVAAMPGGDRNGMRLPVMADLVATLRLDSLLGKAGISPQGENFEQLYSDLYMSRKSPELLEQIEDAVRSYFGVLALPDEPTIYDYLVLSLREKDVIATFNWDPFLFKVCQRHYGKAPLPRVLYLHGNVAVGYCKQDRVKGPIQSRCMKCGKPFTSSRLLFPVTEKDYTLDPLIRGEWEDFECTLEAAYLLTIFGYGAPVTDAKAVEVMKSAWSRPGVRELEEVEIINVKTADELYATWNPFIVRTHYRIHNDYFNSMLARWPRRTCEAIWNQFMMLKLSQENSAPRGVSLNELQAWHAPLVEAEEGV
jgi:hypothetical protein